MTPNKQSTDLPNPARLAAQQSIASSARSSGVGMNESIVTTIDDPAARALALRLRLAAGDVTEPQRSRILRTLPNTLFISHTSLDDSFIKGADEGSTLPRRESILGICLDRFQIPFTTASEPAEPTATSVSWVWHSWRLRACSWSGPRMLCVPTMSERNC
jgi:hypothetical protein